MFSQFSGGFCFDSGGLLRSVPGVSLHGLCFLIPSPRIWRPIAISSPAWRRTTTQSSVVPELACDHELRASFSPWTTRAPAKSRCRPSHFFRGALRLLRLARRRVCRRYHDHSRLPSQSPCSSAGLGVGCGGLLRLRCVWRIVSLTILSKAVSMTLDVSMSFELQVNKCKTEHFHNRIQELRLGTVATQADTSNHRRPLTPLFILRQQPAGLFPVLKAEVFWWQLIDALKDPSLCGLPRSHTPLIRIIEKMASNRPSGQTDNLIDERGVSCWIP